MLAALLVLVSIAVACSDVDDIRETTLATTTTGQPAEATAVPETTATPGSTTTSEADPHPQYGGEVVVASDQEPQTLNWFVRGGEDPIVSIIGQSYWAGVFEIDGHTLDFVPELVTELPTVGNGGITVNDDGTMTVEYQIRDEAVWSDGTPISGDDFQNTLDIILDPELPVAKTTYESIVSTEVGPKTFSFTMSSPTVVHESLFQVVLPKHAVEGTDLATDWNETMWPSAGPFVFDRWQKGEFIKVVRNENYWKSDAETGQQLPYLDSVVFRFIPETESIVSAFGRREVDIVSAVGGRETIESLQSLEPVGAIVEVLAGPSWEYLHFQFGPGRLERNQFSANENLDYRKGVAHAINKGALVDEILAGHVEPLSSFVDAYSPTFSTAAWAQYDYNPAKAEEHFEAAKAELDVDELHTVFTTTSNNEMRVRLAELLVEMFADVGVTYENQLEDSQLFLGETLRNGRWDLGEWAMLGSPGLAGLIQMFELFDPEAPPPDGFNWFHWGTSDSSVINDGTARFAEIRDELNESVDAEILIPLIQEGEQILADQVVVIPLFTDISDAAVWGDQVGGFKHNPSQASYTWNIEDWHRLDL